MSTDHFLFSLLKLIAAIMVSTAAITTAMAQVPAAGHMQPQPETPPDTGKPPKATHRIGTAVSTPHNSVSIKSTDAGIIRRQPPASGCANCGIIDFVNKITQGSGLNAIAGGVVAGAVAREVLRQAPHPHGASGDQSTHPASPDGQYQIGITMDDGRRAIIHLPESANFHQGDRVKWVDGVLVIDR